MMHLKVKQNYNEDLPLLTVKLTTFTDSTNSEKLVINPSGRFIVDDCENHIWAYNYKSALYYRLWNAYPFGHLSRFQNKSTCV